MPANPSTSAQKLILAIETSNPSAATDPAHAAGVAIGRVRLRPEASLAEVLGVDVLAHEWLTPPTRPVAGAGAGPSSTHPASLNADDTLLPAIERLLERAGVRPEQLDRVAVSVGPGGYTGLRVACAAGKMLAQAARWRQTDRDEHDRCACVSVPSHLVAAVGAARWFGGHGVEVDSVRVALASKGESAWVSAPVIPHAPNLQSNTGGHVLFAREFLESSKEERAVPGARVLVADRYLPASMRAVAEEAGLVIHPPLFDPRAALALTAAMPPIDPADLNPLYPREPDAVILWRQRHSASPGR